MASMRATSYEQLARQWRWQAPQVMLGKLRPFLRRGMETLDVGCGTGLVGVLLAREGCIVDGVDRERDMIAAAEATGVYRSLVRGDVRRLPLLDLPRQQYDVVISVGVYGDYIAERHVTTLFGSVTQGGFLALAGMADTAPILSEGGFDVLANERERAFVVPGSHWVLYDYVVGKKR